MSESHGGFFLPFPFGGDPEEMMRRMQEQADRKDMQVDDYRHGTARFVDGLTEEQLAALREMLHVIVTNSDPTSRTVPAFYEGVVSGLLHAKFKICLGCDHNHDKVMAEQLQNTENLAPNPAAQEDWLDGSKGSPEPMDGGDPFKPVGLGNVDLQIGDEGVLSVTQVENMLKYNLDDVRDSDDGDCLVYFKCVNCGKQYPTIEDRMLRPPDKSGCPGCVQKEKWG